MLGLDSLPSGNEVVELIKTQAKNFADQAEQVQHQFDDEVSMKKFSPVWRKL